MQIDMLIDLLLDLLTDPLILLILIVVIVVGIGIIKRGRGPKGAPILKDISRIKSDIEKGKEPRDVSVDSRQAIITRLFNTKMQKLGLTPSSTSGHMPILQNPLASFLRDNGTPEETVDAILQALAELESEDEVKQIITATASTDEVKLSGVGLEKAQQLAVDEWRKLKGISE